MTDESGTRPIQAFLADLCGQRSLRVVFALATATAFVGGLGTSALVEDLVASPSETTRFMVVRGSFGLMFAALAGVLIMGREYSNSSLTMHCFMFGRVRLMTSKLLAGAACGLAIGIASAAAAMLGGFAVSGRIDAPTAVGLLLRSAWACALVAVIGVTAMVVLGSVVWAASLVVAYLSILEPTVRGLLSVANGPDDWARLALPSAALSNIVRGADSGSGLFDAALPWGQLALSSLIAVGLILVATACGYARLRRIDLR